MQRHGAKPAFRAVQQLALIPPARPKPFRHGEGPCVHAKHGSAMGIRSPSASGPAMGLPSGRAGMTIVGRELRSHSRTGCAIICYTQNSYRLTPMAFDQLKMQISMLLTQMQNEPEDRHELYLQLREKLGELKAVGMPLPADLVKLEHDLEEEFARDNGGMTS